MPYEMQWLHESRLSYVHVWGDATVEEMKEFSETVRGWIANGTPLVHHIADFREVESYPNKVGEVLSSMGFMKEPNLGWVIILSDDRMVNFLSAVATSFTRARFRTFSTLAEGLVFLAEQDSTLPDLSGIEDVVLNR